ncbi:MAG TPA: hypothetical protein VGM02_12885 [Acidobacteriaceae bacterium]|jgi:hypothetical protein
MDTTYRLRFLLYLAAFMLVMSACFVYAEPLPAENHLLFQIAPQHAGFLASSSNEPVFDPAALRATAPAVSPQLIEQLEGAAHAHRGFLHRSRRAIARPVPANAQSQSQSESSVLGLTIASPTFAASAR